MIITPRHAHRRRMQFGINLTPLLDVIFNLLFFFVLATTLRQEMMEMNVQLPEAAHGETRRIDKPPAVTLDARGAIVYNDQAMTLETLSLYLYKEAQNGQRSVEIFGDEGVDFGRVIEVMDACKAAGLDEVRWQLRNRDQQP